MKKIWNKFANLGITHNMLPIDVKAITLINKISFISFTWFSLMTIISIAHFEWPDFLLSFSNVVLFGLNLLLNYFRKFTLCKNYFVLAGLIMVTMINTIYGTDSVQMVQFMTVAVFPVLIFRQRKAVYFYFLLTVLVYCSAAYYQQYFSPLFVFPGHEWKHSAYVSIFIIMVVILLMNLFFRGLGEDFEQKLILKNKELENANLKLEDAIQKLKSTQEQLVNSEKMASLGQLTAGIAHEINNPINFVSANVKPLKKDFAEIKELLQKVRNLHETKNKEAILKEIDDYANQMDIDFIDQEIEKLLNGIDEGAQRTKEIVLGLRSFSRMDEDEFKKVDIHDGLDSTLMLLKNKLKNRINIHKEYDNIPVVECLPGKINQAILNIVNNAAQAIESEGDIYISTKFDKTKNRISISISDNGRGIPKPIRKKIFEPFFTTKEVGQGTGLGLSITYGIIEKHNGSIEVVSEAGKGSEFIITLPIMQN